MVEVVLLITPPIAECVVADRDAVVWAYYSATVLVGALCGFPLRCEVEWLAVNLKSASRSTLFHRGAP